ncbi:hypothetical protein [Leucobacter manosquensis]|uniref:CBU-0592-like domain-containing protein n=1 Tax=Leucobacter manosquensis TaxID=2810611 RepID=A0ABS5M5P2_9MICO|nr:hypothetical protein [Leucobacter manosquensis]MBS3182519.1 hypothetical protein [Leucobacter manosquensis]
METLIGSVLGWVGTLGTFVAYVLMLRGTWSPSTRAYLTLNTVGGLLAAGGALAYGAWPSFASNIVWGLMGAYGLLATFRRRSAPMCVEDVPGSPSTSAATLAMTVPLPVLPLPQSPWDPSNTVAAPISLPWLPRADTAETPSKLTASQTQPAALAA